MRFSRGKHTAARTPCTRGRSIKRSDPRGSSSPTKLAGNKDASNTTTAVEFDPSAC